jgi:hypothetical protein
MPPLAVNYLGAIHGSIAQLVARAEECLKLSHRDGAGVGGVAGEKLSNAVNTVRDPLSWGQLSQGP